MSEYDEKAERVAAIEAILDDYHDAVLTLSLRRQRGEFNNESRKALENVKRTRLARKVAALFGGDERTGSTTSMTDRSEEAAKQWMRQQLTSHAAHYTMFPGNARSWSDELMLAQAAIEALGLDGSPHAPVWSWATDVAEEYDYRD